MARTPFYVERRQVSDSGRIVGTSGTEAVVRRVVRQGSNRPRLHWCRWKGVLPSRTGRQRGGAEQARDATRRNHTPRTAHSALRTSRRNVSRQVARLAGEAALRLRSLRADPARTARRYRANRERAGLSEHRRAHRSPVDRGGNRERSNGVVRRKVRRQGSRRLDRGLQHRALRRHAREGHGRHRFLHDYRG